jgi:putative ABC transport system substrate-binding protein
MQQFDQLKRREFIALLGGAAAAWPLAGHAQREGMRRMGVLTSLAASDPQAKLRITALKQELARLGWSEERNLRTEVRWPGDDTKELQFYADELLELKPDVILAGNQSALAPLRKETRIPIVFVQVNDPVAAGIVKSLAKPGGNITGFIAFEETLSGKWVEALKEAAPHIRRMMVLVDGPSPSLLLKSIESASSSLDVELTSVEGPRRSGDRVCLHRFCGWVEWRCYCHAWTRYCSSSRADNCGGYRASAARNLSVSLLGRERWVDVLWNRYG